MAMALLARSRGGRVASTTVSIVKVGGEGVVVDTSLSASTFEVNGSLSSLVTVSMAGEVGGLVRRSCTSSNTSFMFWSGRLACSSLILSIILSSSGDAAPDKDGVRAVQSNSSAWGRSCNFIM